MLHLTPYYHLLAFFLVPVFAAPTLQNRSPNFKDGDIVGVRPGELEGKSKAIKDVSIHPGVVLGSPSPTTGKFPVAMISKKLPHNPPQAPIQNFYHGSALHGNIKLAPPKEIENAKPWKNQQTGGRQSPMSPAGVQKLRDAMKPHAGWRTPPPGSRSRSPSPSRIPILKGKQQQAQSVPEWRRRPPQGNAHASGSKNPVPPRAAAPGPASRKPNPATKAHGNPSKQPATQRSRPPHRSNSKAPAAASQPRRSASKIPRPASRSPPPAHRIPRPASRSPSPASRIPRPASRSPRPASRSPSPASRIPRPASRSPTRPGSPPNRPAGSSSKQKGKQPVRGKREFIRRRAVPSDC